MARLSHRIYFILSAFIAIVGSVLMQNGGRQHPMISSAMGPLGSQQFFHSFAMMMTTIPNWRSIHAQIMSGPVLWAVATVGLAAWLRSRGDKYWSTAGLVSVAMGGVVWIMTYLDDGFVSPWIAPYLLGANKADVGTITTMFGASQQATLTLALPGWFLIAGGTAFLAIGILSTFNATASVLDRSLCVVLGVSGFIFGIWPGIAKLNGTFDPGPMLSPWWAATASGMQLWFVILALWVVFRQFKPAKVTTNTKNKTTTIGGSSSGPLSDKLPTAA